MLPPGRYVLTGRAQQPRVFHTDPPELGDQGRNGFILASDKHRSVTLSAALLFPAQPPSLRCLPIQAGRRGAHTAAMRFPSFPAAARPLPHSASL